MKDSGRQIRGGARAISKHTDGRMTYGSFYIYKYTYNINIHDYKAILLLPFLPGEVIINRKGDC